MVGSSLKSLMQTGLGAVGKAFGISGKPDGSPGNPLWVRMSGIPGLSGTSGTASAAAAGGGWMSKIAGALGFGGKSGDGNANYGGTVDNASPMDWGGFMADGGPVSASSAYIVGENGPEVLTGASGRITSHTELSRTFGGGGPTTIQYGPIDARGADLGAHNRIMRGLEMSSRAAAAAGVQGAAERAKRVPVRSGR
jgi:hypothetical protein